MQDALGDNPDPAGTLLSFVEQMSADEVEALRSALRAAKRRNET